MRTKAEAAQVRRVAYDKGLRSSMNDTKWREVCEALGDWAKPPRFRIRDLLAVEGFVSTWDREWRYHTLPYVSIEWLEVELQEEEVPAALAMCNQIGADVERSTVGLRIWGWRGGNAELA